ncbi:MAG: hypothetical protein ACYCYQ_15260 [Acidimicrobiales bacterium]
MLIERVVFVLIQSGGQQLAREAAGGLISFIDVIRRRLTSSFLVHADETSDQWDR